MHCNRQSHLFLAQVLFLQTTILVGRILPLLILLVDIITLTILLTCGQNPSVAIILLMDNWPMFSVILLTHLMPIRLLVLILIQEELKLTFPILLVVLSSTTSTIIFTSMQILCNSIWTL